MASGAGKTSAFGLLLLNSLLYFIVIIIAAWAVNHSIENAREAASVLPIPARIFPIYFPFGNMATGFTVIFALIAGMVGLFSSINGVRNVLQWDLPSLHAAAASSLISWLLTLLAMGFACKEIDLGWTDATLRTLETILIILGGTQMFCTAALYVGVEDIVTSIGMMRGRV